MDRRQLLKGMAALPLARLSYGNVPPLCKGTCTPAPIKDSLLVWLEGAFAVVINRDHNPVDITAFSPVDADHLAKIESLPQGMYPEQFHLTLQRDGIVSAAEVCISSDFNYLCEEKLGK